METSQVSTKEEFVNENHARRTANYQPNIWNYDHLQSFSSNYKDEKYKREAKELKDRVSRILGALKDDCLHKLELIDEITKLSLSHYFGKEIIEAVKEIASTTCLDHDLYSSALYFRILRQNGYRVSQDVILSFMNDEESASLNAKAIPEIFEASHLVSEDECLLDIATKDSISLINNPNNHDKIYTAKCPLHWSVSWFNVKRHIHECDQQNRSVTLARLATLSFNMVQFQHQKDLKEILRWWRNLGLLEVLTFTRDRVVESFLWAVGVAYEPQYGSLRKWLTKAIMLVLIIDDVYDIYGSKQELEQFTTAIERWDPREIQQLPEAIKKCFWALYDTSNQIDVEIQKEKGWDSVLPQLKKVWTDFCKALLVEAKWYHNGNTPSLWEYLDNGWTSSSGPVLSLHVLFGIGQDLTQILEILNNSQEIIHYASLIIRLCNDQGTSKAELERGDAPSSILCYMREANVTEEEGRDYIRNIITYSWKKINGLFITSFTSQQPLIKYIINTARVANFIYQNGDGFGVQDRETRDQVLSCLIEHLPL